MDAAMTSAVSALQAQSTALSTISNNLANSQTTGYKSVDTQFTSLLTELTNGSTFTSGGVSASARQNLLSEGTVTATSMSTDMAINGNGMFAVSYGVSGGQSLYTRNGAFDSDASGNLYLSGTNYYLKGWPTDTNGKVLAANSDNIASLETVNVDKYNSSAVATTNYSLQANLPAEAQSTLANIPYTNAAGTSENVTMTYAKIDSTAATAATDPTSTYLLTINAPTGKTIDDGATLPATFSQLTYQVTVDTSAVPTHGGIVIGITGVTPGATAQYTNGATTASSTLATLPTPAVFPDVIPSDNGGAAITYPTSWGVGAPYTPTWSTLTTTMASGFSKSTSMATYDSLGVEQTFPVTWTATGENTWLMTVGTPTNAAGTQTTGQLIDSAGTSVDSYSYQVTFNSDGTLGSFKALPSLAGGGVAPTTTTGTPELLASWADGAAASTGTSAITLNLGTVGTTSGLSQFDTGETAPLIAVKNTSQNGVQYGQLSGVSIDTSGDVIASYDNGQKVPIYKIPIVTFPNENGLTAMTDGVYEQSSLSGNYTLNEAGTNGAGSTEGSSLEGSTVNTSTEFSNMITAQQAYSSASQVISTDKQMFQALIQVIQ
jgi:flagellar hook-basal body protein